MAKLLCFIIKEPGFEAKYEKAEAVGRECNKTFSTIVIAHKGKQITSPILVYSIVRHSLASMRQANIVHIHGCWSFTAFIVYIAAIILRKIVIVSPMGSLAFLNIANKKFWKRYLPKWLLYQWIVVKTSHYFIAGDYQEYNFLKKRNKKAGIACINKTSSNDKISEMLTTLYRHIIDVHCYKFMNDNEKLVLDMLFRRGLDKYIDSEHAELFNSQHHPGWIIADDGRQIISDITPNGWDRIGLLANKMQIWSFVNSAAWDYNICINPEKGTKTRKIAIDNDIFANIKQLKRAFKKKSTSTYSLLGEMYIALKYRSYDEEEFIELIRKTKNLKFVSRVEDILVRKLFLEEGYMPLPPIYDKGTKRLYARLEKSIKHIDYHIPETILSKFS